MYQNYHRNLLRRQAAKEKRKTIVIVALAITVALLLGVVLNLKRAYSLREYSIANNCSWTYLNTAYGDDRDWVCK